MTGCCELSGIASEALDTARNDEMVKGEFKHLGDAEVHLTFCISLQAREGTNAGGWRLGLK